MDSGSALAVLMALRVRGRADAAVVARGVGCSVDAAMGALARLEAEGAVAPVAGGSVPAPATRVLTLTEAGRTTLARLVAAEPLDRAELAAVYERFLVADRDLKATITAWQLAAEDAKPAARDAVLISTAAAGGVAAALAVAAPRFAPYPHRIAAAAAAIATGDARFVASPRVDSLHQVWFELHEDLLVTLGRSRGS